MYLPEKSIPIQVPKAKPLLPSKKRQGLLPFIGKEAVNIWLVEGTHYVSKTLVLDSRYSASAGKGLTIQGLGRKVWVKGSRQLANLKWRQYKGRIKVATLPEGIRFDQLFINSVNQVRARFPNYDYSNPLRDGKEYQPVTGGTGKRFDQWFTYDSLAFPKRNGRTRKRVLSMRSKATTGGICSTGSKTATTKTTKSDWVKGAGSSNDPTELGAALIPECLISLACNWLFNLNNGTGNMSDSVFEVVIVRN